MSVSLFLSRLLGHASTVTFHGWSQAGVMARCLGMSREKLILEHTGFSFITSVMPSSESGRRLAVAGTSDEQAANHIMNPRSTPHGLRRWCPKCTKQDLRTYGDSHWRVCHNLPGVVACHEHECQLLVATENVATSGRILDTFLPGVDLDGVPIGVPATAFHLAYAKLVREAISTPTPGRTGDDGFDLLTRLETLGICVTDKRIFRRELRHMFESLLGSSAELILGDSVEAAIRNMSRAPWDPKALRTMPNRFAAIQAALELPSNEVARHLPGSIVVCGRDRTGASPRDEETAAIAEQLIDEHLRRQEKLPIPTVLKECGLRTVPRGLNFPKLTAQLARLSALPISGRRNGRIGLTDAQLAQTAQEVIRTQRSLGRKVTIGHVLAACGVKGRKDPSLYPCFEAVMDSLQRSRPRDGPRKHGVDEHHADVAKRLIDEAIESNTRLPVRELVRALPLSGRLCAARRGPLLTAQIERLKAAEIGRYRSCESVDARSSAIASRFIDSCIADGRKVSVSEVMRQCDLNISYACRPGYPLLRAQLDRLKRSPAATRWNRIIEIQQ